MKIITWNIGEDERNKNGKLDLASYEYIVNTIIEKNADVICLQEAIIKSDYLPSIANYIKANTDLKYNVEFELSDSHINIGCRMGVIICSKYKINNYESFMLDNPNLIYSKDEDTTYYSHDKGFIIAQINNFNVITGHCLPFHIFNKSPLDYLNIFEKADNKFMNIYNQNNNFILCGDFNYNDINKLFPVTMQNCIDLVDKPTRKDKKLDHFIINKNINIQSVLVMNNRFDHKLCFAKIEEGEIQSE